MQNKTSLHKKFLSVILVVAMTVSLGSSFLASAADDDTYKGVITFQATSGSSLTSMMVNTQLTAAGVGPSDTFSAAFGDSVRSIGSRAFSGRIGLTSVAIPDSVMSIGYSAFSRCTSLTEINVNPGNDTYSSIDGVVFNKDQTALLIFPPGKPGEYTIPNSVVTIGSDAFMSCTSLTNVVIPDSVITIEDWAFAGCSSLVNVVIPNSVITIGDVAFEDCASLTNVFIGSSVTSIGDGAFGYCSMLEGAYFYGQPPSTFGSDVFDGTDPEFTIYYLHDQTGWTYPIWKGYRTEPFGEDEPSAELTVIKAWVGGLDGYTEDRLNSMIAFNPELGQHSDLTPGSVISNISEALPVSWLSEDGRKRYTIEQVSILVDGVAGTNLTCVENGVHTIVFTNRLKVENILVLYNPNGGTGAPPNQIFTTGTWTTLSTVRPTFAGSTFIGWSTNATATKVDYLPGEWIFVDKIITLYAVWHHPATAAYRLEYYDNINNVTVPALQSFTTGTWTTVSTVKPTSVGYTFMGWSTNATATKVDYLPGEWIYVDKVIELYAVWHYPPTAAYRLEYTDSVNGATAPAMQSFTIGTWTTVSTVRPVSVGSTFMGWSTDPAATNVDYSPGEWIYVDKAITLYAVWSTTVSYRIEYNNSINSAAVPATQSFTTGTWTTVSTVRPTFTGYTFRGWSTSEQATTVQYLPGEWIYVDKAIKLYAVWQ